MILSSYPSSIVITRDYCISPSTMTTLAITDTTVELHVPTLQGHQKQRGGGGRGGGGGREGGG